MFTKSDVNVLGIVGATLEFTPVDNFENLLLALKQQN